LDLTYFSDRICGLEPWELCIRETRNPTTARICTKPMDMQEEAAQDIMKRALF